MTSDEAAIAEAVAAKLTERFYVGQRVLPKKEYCTTPWLGVVASISGDRLFVYEPHKPENIAMYESYFFEPAPCYFFEPAP